VELATTQEITAKLRGQNIGEDGHDLPACCSAPNRKIDGFIGNLT
jgi:hypothetical protein